MCGYYTTRRDSWQVGGKSVKKARNRLDYRGFTEESGVLDTASAKKKWLSQINNHHNCLADLWIMSPFYIDKNMDFSYPLFHIPETLSW